MFPARAGSPTQQKALIVDLYATGAGVRYDSPEQDRVVQSFEGSFQTYSTSINSGATPLPEALVRISTQLQAPIELQDVQLGEVLTPPPLNYKLVGSTSEGMRIVENPRAAPQFRVSTRLRPARDLTDAHAILMEDPSFDPGIEAVVEGLNTVKTLAPGRILSDDVHTNAMRADVETMAEASSFSATVCSSDGPETVDGKETQIHISNGFARGVFVGTTGKHSIEMSFIPRSLGAYS